ncbi:MAG: 30S ribosomal protein S1, partial [Microbacterium sp.]|nr:30S ribosomal protein S1 [Microbacterium sp.]
QEYAAAQARWEAHKATVAKAAEAEAAKEADDSYSGSSASGSGSYSSESPVGTLADDEALAALREKLSGR